MTGFRNKYLLSPRKQDAIASILASRTIAEAAKNAGVSERTLYRWLDEPAFQTELHKQESRAIKETSHALLVLTAEAIQVVSEILKNKQINPSIRLKAAETVFNNLIRIREIASLEERVVALEEMSSNYKLL